MGFLYLWDSYFYVIFYSYVISIFIQKSLYLFLFPKQANVLFLSYFNFILKTRTLIFHLFLYLFPIFIYSCIFIFHVQKGSLFIFYNIYNIIIMCTPTPLQVPPISFMSSPNLGTFSIGVWAAIRQNTMSGRINLVGGFKELGTGNNCSKLLCRALS